MTPPARSRRLTRFLLLWLLYAPVVSLAWSLVRWVGDGGPPNWVDTVALGVLVGAVYAGIECLLPRSPAGEAGDRAARRAVQRGVLPDDVDAAAMRAALLHVKRLSALSRRWGLPFLVVVTAGMVALTVAGDLGGAGVFVTGLCVAALAGLVWLTAWQPRRVDRLLAELDARPAGAGKPLDR